MNEKALHKIRQIKQRYILYHLLADLCVSGIIALACGIALHVLFGLPFVFTPILFVIAFSAYVFVRRIWLVNDEAIVGFLDAFYPELEESSGLALMKADELNLLQQIQLSKVAPAIEQIPVIYQQFKKRLYFSVFLLIATLGLAFLVIRYNYSLPFGNAALDITISANKPVKEILLPEIESFEIIITPPSYTHLNAHTQDKFTIDIVEGAVVNWKLKTNIPVKHVSLLFNDQEDLPMTAVDSKTEWSAKKTINKPGFYQVVIDGKRSDLYLLQVIKDASPVIQIKSPKQYTYIDAGEKPVVNVKVSVNDDYGISDAFIYATVAKGSGEAVKFKEQKISFVTDFSQTLKAYKLEKSIALPSLGLEPGDELYFYIQATDNHNQSSRTNVYIVSIQDTAKLLSMDGILSGANIKPEYFRSERQIILDAEALIKAKDTLKLEQFKDRSNDLGTDQKLLRLRYGKFLGEEAEEGNAGDPRVAENNKPVDPKDFGDGAKILDEYTDKHDNAEDAQFFDPTVKAQLKATLTEMWKAELQLRLYKPQEALPFAYKALRLLKDLQQKSRAFVAKTSYNPTPLKMDKRLSGDLDKIIQPSEHEELKQSDDPFSQLKSAITVLQRLQHNKSISSGDDHLLQLADQQIAERAALQPGVYLNAAKAMRRIMANSKKSMGTDAAIVETAIQRILPAVQPSPQGISSAADMGFSKSYFLKLKHVNP